MNPRPARHLAGALATLLAATLLPAAVGHPSAALAADRVGSVVKRHGDPVAVPPLSAADASATCRRGETLIGGGATGAASDILSMFLRSSAPDPNSSRRWVVRTYNNDSEDAELLTAYAFCARAARRDRVGVIVRMSGTARTVDPG